MLERQLDGGDLFGLAMGEVGERAVFDAPVLAKRFAQENRFVNLAIGRRAGRTGNIHDYYNITLVIVYQELIVKICKIIVTT
jgi:hypothetical protein